MEKGFITTLRGEADNSNLPMYNTIKLGLKNTANGTCVLRIIGAEKCTIEGSAYFTDSTYNQDYGKERTESQYYYIKGISSGNTDVLYIHRKYNVSFLIVSTNCVFDIADAKGAPVTFLQRGDNTTSGNIKGDLNVALSLNKVWTSINLAYEKIYGRIEDIVENEYKNLGVNPRTANINVAYSNPGITLNGNVITALTLTIEQNQTTIVAGSTTVATYNATNNTWTYPS